MPKYPDVSVKLVGQDGNVFHIIGKVTHVLRKEVSHEAADLFREEALQQESYDAVLRLVMQTVEVE